MSSTAPASQIHLRTPPEPGKKPAIRTYLIYFVTGNPGLIEYYRTFLTHLYGVLTHNTASDRSIEFQVYGRSLSGFEMNDAEIKTMKWRKQPPYGLQDQIRHSEDELAELVEEVKESGGAKDVRVVLVGHSVGSYICLEIIRRLRAHGMVGEDFETRVVGAVGLFPTVVDIARSESGMKASVSTFSLIQSGPLYERAKYRISKNLRSSRKREASPKQELVLSLEVRAFLGRRPLPWPIDDGSGTSSAMHTTHARGSAL